MGPASKLVVSLARIADPACTHHRAPGLRPAQASPAVAGGASGKCLARAPARPAKPKPVPAPSPKETKAEKLPEQKVEEPAPQQKQPPKPAPIEVLKPVFQFGDRDAGPRKSLDGGSAQDSSQLPTKNDDSKQPVVARDAQNKSAASSSSETEANAAKDAEVAQEVEKQVTATQDLNKQDADRQEAVARQPEKQTAAAPTPLAVAGSDGEVELPTLAEAPQPRPSNAPKPSPAKVSKLGSSSVGRPKSTEVAVAKSQGGSALPGVRKLYSQGATGDARATTSMAGVPRDKRAARLCASALQQQLMDASYFPNLVPLVPLEAGNILDVPDAAFHAQTTWYNLSFRCEVDTDATRVLSFTFDVGTAIPPDEWARLGLPVRY